MLLTTSAICSQQTTMRHLGEKFEQQANACQKVYKRSKRAWRHRTYRLENPKSLSDCSSKLLASWRPAVTTLEKVGIEMVSYKKCIRSHKQLLRQNMIFNSASWVHNYEARDQIITENSKLGVSSGITKVLMSSLNLCKCESTWGLQYKANKTNSWTLINWILLFKY